MAINFSTSEVLEKAGKFEKVQDRVNYLVEKQTKALKAVLYFCYGPVEWLVPDTDPPYKPSPAESDVQNVLKASYNKLRIYVKGGGYDTLSKTKREMQYIEWLETMDAQDAKLILAIRKGEIPYPGITRHVAKKAFPDIAKDWK